MRQLRCCGGARQEWRCTSTSTSTSTVRCRSGDANAGDAAHNLHRVTQCAAAKPGDANAGLPPAVQGGAAARHCAAPQWGLAPGSGCLREVVRVRTSYILLPATVTVGHR